MFNQIKEYMKQRHVKVNDHWLRQTIRDMSLGENVNGNRVFNEWLNTDLRTIDTLEECDTFNAFLSARQSLEAKQWNGIAVMQLVSVRNSTAADRAVENDFLHLEAEHSDDEQEAFTKAKVKGPRLLSLVFTDGKYEYKAIEYKPIEFLNDQMSYGIKVVLKGPIDVEMGILFLRPNNVEILGGSVEMLVNGSSNGHVL